MYEKGIGVRQSYRDTLKWFRKAAEQEDAFAQNNLGIIHAKGFRDKSIGFFLRVAFANATTDHIEAYKWFTIAAANGYARALKDRSFIAKRMTPMQITRAQELAREFEPSKQG
jgi:TPR repeat protein